MLIGENNDGTYSVVLNMVGMPLREDQKRLPRTDAVNILMSAQKLLKTGGVPFLVEMTPPNLANITMPGQKIERLIGFDQDRVVAFLGGIKMADIRYQGINREAIVGIIHIRSCAALGGIKGSREHLERLNYAFTPRFIKVGTGDKQVRRLVTWDAATTPDPVIELAPKKIVVDSFGATPTSDSPSLYGEGSGQSPA